MTQEDPPPAPQPLANQLCCEYCPPSATVWIETTSSSIFVENSITETRHLDVKRHLDTHANADAKPTLEVRAATNSSLQPPGGPSVNADSFSGAKSLDDTDSDSGTDFDDQVIRDVEVRKDQGKVYRTDTYTVHWLADGEGRLHVSLDVTGAVSYAADWLPRTGEIRLSKTYLLEPPAYNPGGAGDVVATLRVGDCHPTVVAQSNTALRP